MTINDVETPALFSISESISIYGSKKNYEVMGQTGSSKSQTNFFGIRGVIQGHRDTLRFV